MTARSRHPTLSRRRSELAPVSRLEIRNPGLLVRRRLARSPDAVAAAVLFLPLPRTLPRPLRLARSRFPVAPAFWSAFGGPASSHRRGRSGGEIEGLRPRRWDAGGLLLSRKRTASRSRGSPAAPLCAACRVAGRVYRHNGVPGTPREVRSSHVIRRGHRTRMQQPPGHGSDVVEETDCRIGLR